MTNDERADLIRRVVTEAKRERARMMRLILSTIFTMPYRAWTERRAPPRLPNRTPEPRPTC